MVVQGSVLLLEGIFQDVSTYGACGNLIAHGVLLSCPIPYTATAKSTLGTRSS